jgi:histidinol-phosphate aminotransferase
MRVSAPKPRRLIRPLIQSLHAYVPGEQPKIPGLIKLNTNENPYPPSPKVFAALRAAIDPRLRLYPNPTSQALRQKLAAFHQCRPENIIVGNGSDELLMLAVRALVEPADSSPSRTRAARSRSTVQYFSPSYSLYPVLANIHGAVKNSVRLTADFGLPGLALLKKSRAWDFQAALSFVTTPNAPSGRPYKTSELEALCRQQRGVIVLDEAYVDFADENAQALAFQHPHVIVSRTFSKAYSLCFQRVGYFIGNPELIAALDKIRDSYNVNGLGQLAALATLDDLAHYRANFARVIETRRQMTKQLTQLGFDVLPSATNFILVRPPRFSAQQWLQKLRDRKILVRWFASPEVKQFLRITIGTEAEARALIRAAKSILTLQ